MPREESLGSTDPPTLGGYRLEARLGAGGQGTVFRALGPTGNQVAIKVLHRGKDPKVVERFRREVDAAMRVDKFCTARVLHAELDTDPPYLVSEFIDGPTLRDQVIEKGPLVGSVLESAAVGMITALAAIHATGIVHRDFKPENVVLSPAGPRVVDFGIARRLNATQTTSHIMGTAPYMAPEQLNAQEVGTPADVFAWACAVVFAATGRPPYGDESMQLVVMRMLHEPPNLLGVPDNLLNLVASCLARDPGRRPTAPQVLLEMLGMPAPARQASAAPGILAAGSAAASATKPGLRFSTPGRSNTAPHSAIPPSTQPPSTMPASTPIPATPPSPRSPAPTPSYPNGGAGPAWDPPRQYVGETVPPGDWGPDDWGPGHGNPGYGNSGHGNAGESNSVGWNPAARIPPPNFPRPRRRWLWWIVGTAPVVVIVLALAMGLWVRPGGQEKPAARPSGQNASVLAVPAEANQALAVAQRLLGPFLSYNYRTYDANAAAQAKMATPRYAAILLRDSRDFRAKTIAIRAVTTNRVITGGVQASRPGHVTVRIISDELRRDQETPNAVPQRRGIQVTMAKQGTTWLVDDYAYVDGDNSAAGTPAPTPVQDYSWPNAAARTMLTTANTCAKTFVEGSFRTIDDDQTRINDCSTGPLAGGYSENKEKLRAEWTKNQTSVTVRVLDIAVRTTAVDRATLIMTGCMVTVSKPEGIVPSCYNATGTVVKQAGRWVFATYYPQ